jgi:hypothetical protein
MLAPLQPGGFRASMTRPVGVSGLLLGLLLTGVGIIRVPTAAG